MALATPVAADPAEKNHRATSWPHPISAKPPYVAGSRLSVRALAGVGRGVFSAAGLDVFFTALSRRSCYSRHHRCATMSSGFTGLAW
jgi:hypothetical protein